MEPNLQRLLKEGYPPRLARKPPRFARRFRSFARHQRRFPSHLRRANSLDACYPAKPAESKRRHLLQPQRPPEITGVLLFPMIIPALIGDISNTLMLAGESVDAANRTAAVTA